MKRRYFAATCCGLLVQVWCSPYSRAATLNVNATTGNLVVTTADSGTHTIAASGGTNPAPYTITADPGVVLTGDPVTQLGISVTKTGYTIQNNGSLAGALDGIRATTAGVVVIVNNTGTITGGSGAGINALSGTVTSSAGLISGTTGVSFPTAGTSADTLTLTGGTLTGTGGSAAVLGGGNDTFNLTGTAIVNGFVNTGTGNDIVTISGGTINGAVLGSTLTALSLGDGNDTITIDGGTIIGVINCGGGVDTLSFGGDAQVQIAGSGNAISAVEVLNKTGAGTTTTIKGGTQADVINLTAGTLFLNGNISHQTSGSTVLINSAGTHLGGTLSGAAGTWNADLQHTAGTFSPGSTLPAGGLTTSIANLSVKTATFNGGSLLVHANPLANTADKLTITGDLNLVNAPLVISPVTRDAPLSSLTLIDVVGTTSGSFLPPTIVIDDGVTAPTPFTPTTFTVSVVPGTDDPDDVLLHVVHHYEALPGLTSFGTGLATMLNAAVANSAGDPVLAKFLGNLDYSGGAGGASIINALQPDGYLEAQAAAVSTSYLLHRVVENQNDAARSTRNFNRCWANYNLSDLTDGTAHHFTTGFGGGSLVDSTNFGAVISRMMMDDWYGGGSDLDTTTFGVYLGSGELVGWQWNAFAGYSMTEGGFRTRGSGPGTIAPATVSIEGTGLQCLLSGAYVVQDDRISWGPTFGLEYSSFDCDPAAFARAGGPPTLMTNSASLESLRMLLGFKVEYDLPGSTTPYCGVQYVSEFMGDQSGYSVGAGGSSFHVPQFLDLGGDSLLLRAGVMHRFNQNWQLNAGYLGELPLDSGGRDIHTFNLGAMANF